MKVKVFGPSACYNAQGVMQSWAPNQVVEVNEADAAEVAFYTRWVEAGHAELVEEPHTKSGRAHAVAPLGSSTVDRPPKAGPGSGRDAWVAYAEAEGVAVTEDMSRDDIADAVDQREEPT